MDDHDSFDMATEQHPRGLLASSIVRRRRTLRWTDGGGSHAAALDGSVILGSAPDAHVRIHDRAVSRVHAELDVDSDVGGVWLRDLESRNGTFVNGVLCKIARVDPGAEIRVGDTTIVLQEEAGADEEVSLWPESRFGALVARSESMRALFMKIVQYARADAAVLVQGETGTGKELVARAIHDASPRANGAFVVVDCGALPENLIESELFGHARGAFTGAATNREGAIEAAHGGTVFLDEIGELPLAMQPKLLRVLESKTVRRVGETTHRNVDVRFVSATHRDLEKLVATGAFREDLYFRLAVLPAKIPPLRSRPDDVAILAQHFLAQKGPGVGMPPSILGEMEGHAWLGNVRELRSFVDRVATLGAQAAWDITRGETAAPRGDVEGVKTGALPPVSTDVPFKELRERWTDHLEREYIRQLIEVHGRNLNAVAAAGGIDRTYVRRLILKHGL